MFPPWNPSVQCRDTWPHFPPRGRESAHGGLKLYWIPSHIIFDEQLTGQVSHDWGTTLILICWHAQCCHGAVWWFQIMLNNPFWNRFKFGWISEILLPFFVSLLLTFLVNRDACYFCVMFSWFQQKQMNQTFESLLWSIIEAWKSFFSCILFLYYAVSILYCHILNLHKLLYFYSGFWCVPIICPWRSECLQGLTVTCYFLIHYKGIKMEQHWTSEDIFFLLWVFSSR